MVALMGTLLASIILLKCAYHMQVFLTNCMAGTAQYKQQS